MNNSDIIAHTDPIFKQLGLLKLDEIYRIEVAKFMYEHDKHSLPESLTNLFTAVDSIHNYSTRQSGHLRKFNARTNIAVQSILNKGPLIWNQLDDNIKMKQTLQSFTSCLRRDILTGGTGPVV